MKKVLEILNPSIMRLAVIVVPWLATAIYLFAFAADRYVAESMVAVRQEGVAMSLPSGVDTLSAMFGSTMASREDQYLLEAHILSMDMLLQVDEKLGLREAFSAPKLDFIFALREDASQEAHSSARAGAIQ